MNSTARASPSVRSESAGRVARVLVVESRAISGPILRRWLEQRGHTLDVAGDVESGFERAITVRPHVVLIDLGLGAGSGFALANRLGTDPTTKTVPLVAMREATTMVPGKAKAPFARHVLKPIDIDELGAVVLEAAALDAEVRMQWGSVGVDDAVSSSESI